ncbi:MAG TPA: DUF177 domain-containing protein [Acidobacteriaceae bacterium]|nr:DUF177 domain-containing protein [Acidobacteriaceae bacterium]
MLITPLQLADESLPLNESLPEGAVDYAPGVRQIGPLSLTGKAELIVEHRGPREFVEDIRLRAHFEGRFELPCARCLEPVQMPLSGDFDLIYRPASVETEAGEHAITEDETEIGYYEKSGLLLEDAVREQVLLNLPSRALCQQECKGLCPKCGANRNTAECGCVEEQTDPRWSAFNGLTFSNKA